MDLLAVLAQPEQVGSQRSSRRIGILWCHLSLLLLASLSLSSTAYCDKRAGLQELAKVELVDVERGSTAEDGIGVVDVCASSCLERVLQSDP